MYGLSFKHYMRIPPNSPRETAHITFGKIHSSYKSDTTVYHYNLSVITIVDLTRK